MNKMTVRPYHLYNWSFYVVYSFPPGQNGRHFAHDIFKRIFWNENFGNVIQFSLKVVPKAPIDNKSALVQVMAWRRFGAKPLPEPMLTRFTDAYVRHQGETSYDVIIILKRVLVPLYGESTGPWCILTNSD